MRWRPTSNQRGVLQLEKVTQTVGGWDWWIAQIKGAHPEKELDYKALMQQYIKGVKWENVE